jgi:DNA-3-methyladenine glycosylase II
MSEAPKMRRQIIHSTLTDKTYRLAIAELTERDADLATAVSRWGDPPFWTHPPGFAGIVIAILSQQVSLESARSTFSNLENAIGAIHPAKFQPLDDSTLRDIGFSRQKASYVRGVARQIATGEFDIEALETLDDDQARIRLMSVKGIGPWTADTYLLFALRRSNAWPSGDLALAKAIQELSGLITVPGAKEVDGIADQWRPWRAVAARILWHFYLSERGRTFH